MRHLALSLSIYGLLFALAAPARSDPPATCPVDKCNPGAFPALFAKDTCPKCLPISAPINATAECYQQTHAMSCEAYPQEYKPSGFIKYQWRVKVGMVTTTYPRNTNPFVFFPCSALQHVTATVTVWNGTATSTDTVGYTCGDDPQ